MERCITFIPDKESFQVSWKCVSLPIKNFFSPTANEMQRCNYTFHSLVQTTNQQIAEKYWRRMNWDVQRDGPMVIRHFKAKWIEELVWSVAPGLLAQEPRAKSSEQARPGTEEANTQITHVCLYQRENRFWRLHHAKLCRPDVLTSSQDGKCITTGATTIENAFELPSVPEGMPDGLNMNRELFYALREKILEINPSKTIPWKSGPSARSWPWPWLAVSGLELWEVGKYPSTILK